MRNVVVNGASTPLGRRLLQHLRRLEAVQNVVGVEPAATSDWIDGIELVAFAPDHRALTEFLSDNDIDTVIHCGLATDRSGGNGEPGEARVVETMRLGAALASAASPVRSWVVVSSSSVYPVSSKAPLLQREDSDIRSEGGAESSLLEAEAYVRDVADFAPHLNVSILRLQQLVGAGIHSPLSALLGQPVLPAIIGFDAPLQLLAVEDAVRAIAFAGQLELAGVYNVASAGIMRFREALRSREQPALPVLPVPAGPFEGLARRLGIPHVPRGMLLPLCFGHALDTSKLTAAGFEPEYDQAGCLAQVARQA